MSKLTSEQIDRIIELREANISTNKISKAMGLPRATVNYQLLKHGIDPWSADKNGGDGHHSRFTKEEDARLLALARTKGMSEVARLMNRARTSVLIRLMTLEVRAEAALEKAA